VAVHAKDAVRRPGIAQILDLPLAVPTAEAGCAECLVARQDGEVLDLVPAGAAAVGAVVADEGTIAEQE
jgi:ABC-type sulfate transport system permease component